MATDNLTRVHQVFVNNGTALPATGTGYSGLSAGQLAAFGINMLQVNTATATTSTEPGLYLVYENTDGSLKRSMKMEGPSIVSYKGARFQADTREVWAIGYNRKTASGAIEVNNDTNYTFAIGLKYDKELYSERNLDFRFSFQSSTTATQSNIADIIVSKINNQAGLKADVVAVKVGNGTGAYGLTGATAFGVEITGKDIAQFSNTQYKMRRPYFVVTVDDTTGFESTTACSQINAMDYGVGMYQQIYNLENFAFQFEGVLNRRLWPIPTIPTVSSDTWYNSSSIGVTVATTTGLDVVTFSGSVAAILTAGDRVVLDGVNYEIKYFVSNTVAVLTAPATTTNATGAALKRLQYSTISIEFNDVTNSPTGVMSTANKAITIAFPAITAGSAYNSVSTVGTSLKQLFDGWMASTPGNFAAITI